MHSNSRVHHPNENDAGKDGESKTKRAKKKARTESSVMAVLKAGMEAIDTYEMKLHAFRFAMRYVFEQDDVGNRDAVKQSHELAASIMKTCEGQTVSSDLALEQVEYYLEQGSTEQAINVLSCFCTKSKGEAPSALWIRWASLFEQTNRAKAKQILKRGLGHITLGKSDHISVLLQYFGCLLHEEETDKAILNDTFQRVLLLAPTLWGVDVEDVSEYWFGTCCLAQAYLGYLKLASSQERQQKDEEGSGFGSREVRTIYESVLFRSTIHLSVDSPNYEYLQAFVDEVLQLDGVSTNKTLFCRVCEKAVEIFKGSSLEQHYRQCRNDGAIYSKLE